MRQIYNTRKISDNLFQITEDHFGTGEGVRMYLVTGTEKAALIDSGFGVTDTLKEYVSELTDKPVICLLGHGHPDHAGAAALFDDIYMNPRDEELLAVSLSYERRMGDVFHGDKTTDPKLWEYCNEHIVMPEKLEYNELEDGDEFDLGEIVLHAFWIPGHTQGSMAFVEKNKKYALVSDAFSYRTALVTLPKEKRAGITNYRNGLESFLNYINEDTELYWGHGFDPVDHRIPKDMLKACNEVLNGNVENDIKSESHFARRLAADSGKLMMEHICGSVKLVYDANTL